MAGAWPGRREEGRRQSSGGSVPTGWLSPGVKSGARSAQKNTRKQKAEFSWSGKMSHTPMSKMTSLIASVYEVISRRPGAQSCKQQPVVQEAKRNTPPS